MSAFYNRMAQTASRLLEKFGAEVTVIRNVNGSIDPVTGATQPGSSKKLKGKGIFSKLSDDFAQIDGGLVSNDSSILASDRMLILDSSFEPLITDRPMIGGQSWSIVEIKTVKPADVPFVYALRVRR